MSSHENDISWQSLRQLVREWFGTAAELAEVRPLEGGCINCTLCLTLRDGSRSVLKVSPHRVTRTFADEAWRPVYEVVPTNDSAAVADEVARQVAAFVDLMGRNPTHFDSHQHVHRTEPVRSIVGREARKSGVVLRDDDPEVRYCGDFYGQSDKGDPYPEGISVERMLKIIHNLSPGTTELGCHPGASADLDSIYRSERAIECQTLCDPRIRAAIMAEDIVLCSFSDWRRPRA